MGQFKPSRPAQFSAPAKTKASGDDVRALADALLAASKKLRALSALYDSPIDQARIGSRALQRFAERSAGMED